MKQNQDDFFFSQNALRLFSECPLRFRLRYCDGYFWPRALPGARDARAHIEQGRLFHLLAERLVAGADAAPPRGPWQLELGEWLQALQRFLPPAAAACYPELELRYVDGSRRLLAKYDLFVVRPDGAVVIYDWKTEDKPPDAARLSRSWQTLVYRFMAVAAAGAYVPGGAVQPEQVCMVYWNPRYATAPVTVGYDAAAHSAAAAQIGGLIDRILQTPGDAFGATEDERVCGRCEYSPLCHGRAWTELAAEDLDELLLDDGAAWDDITEAPY